MTPDPSLPAITLAWLVRLRWGAAALQALTVAGSVLVLNLALPVGPLAALIGATFVTNVALEVVRRRRVPSWIVHAVFVTDTLLLTGLLYFAGGPSNPFSVLYLVHVTLAALVLGLPWAWVVVALSSACYGMLFFAHVHVHELGHEHGGLGLHLQGMWAAFTLAAGMIAYFVSRVAGALRARETEARDAAARMEKLASLTTLAAGAAHELGTPLGTIAIAAGELARALEREPGPLLDDARLIRDELLRCRAILDGMSLRAGDGPVEKMEAIGVASALARLPADFGTLGERIKVNAPDAEARVLAPTRAFSQALTHLVRNALDASADSVLVSAKIDGERVLVRVRDEGAGMPPDVLAHMGEPFFTTKAAGKGMGLGVFLAQTLAMQLHGTLRFESEVGRGTTATLDLPRAAA